MRIISNKKIEQFRSKLQEKGIDVALFLTSEPIHDVNIEYFTGFQQPRFFSFGCLLMTQEKMILTVSPLSYDQTKEVEVDEVINLRDYQNSLTRVLREKLKGLKTVGVLERIFPCRLYKKFHHIKFQDISNIILGIRSTKEPGEIERIQKACGITNHGIKFIEKNLSSKIREKELALILEQELIRKGADELAFPTVVTSGKRSAFVHPYPSFTDKKIQEGLGLVDFGVRYQGYCSDVTVPFAMGKLSRKQEEIMRTVENAYQEAIENIDIYIPTWKVHDSVERIIRKNGFEFKHETGHGLGLDLHDLPPISSRPKDKEELKDWKETRLKESMVFTIEPGIYTPELGGFRIEDIFLVTDNGAKVLA